MQYCLHPKPGCSGYNRLCLGLSLDRLNHGTATDCFPVLCSHLCLALSPSHRKKTLAFQALHLLLW